MPLRSSRFYLFGDLHYYEHIRLPRLRSTIRNVRVSHVHVLPSPCTQHLITPDICWIACCHFFVQHVRFHQLREIDRYHLCNEASLMQLTGTVTPELRKVRFLTVRQVFFNLNGKLGCKVLSSLKVFLYIYTRLVAHQSTQS